MRRRYSRVRVYARYDLVNYPWRALPFRDGPGTPTPSPAPAASLPQGSRVDPRAHTDSFPEGLTIVLQGQGAG